MGDALEQGIHPGMSALALEQATGHVAAATAHAVTKAFGGRKVLDGVNLSIAPGEIVAIVGESGCGKSTLLRLLAGLETPTDGAVSVAGQISIAFQDARLLPWLRVRENVAFGLPASRDQRSRKALAALGEVGLAPHASGWPGTLSGGEGQRVALARALIRDPAVLLLDEPFGALDALTRLRMHTLLLKLWQRHRFTVVLVTHDVDEALALSDRVVVLGGGSILDEFAIDLPRPRNRLNPQLGALRNRLLERLGVPLV